MDMAGNTTTQILLTGVTSLVLLQSMVLQSTEHTQVPLPHHRCTAKHKINVKVTNVL
jgi:hypothetical protein